MSKLTSPKLYLLISLAAPAAVLTALLIIENIGILELVIGAILFYIFFPCMMLGIYIWATGRGYNWINGPNWAVMSENTMARGARVSGLATCVSLAVVLIGVMALFECLDSYDGFLLGFVSFIACIVGGVAIIMYAVVKVSRKSFEEKWRYRTSPAPSKTAVFTAVVLSVLLLIPVGLSISNMGSDADIDVVLNDDDFSVTGPWFDHTFGYSQIDTLYLDEDFEKGKRRGGYGTSTIQSGRFHNSQFGYYELASYAKIGPCIVITVNGEYYAFNQSSVDSTNDLYEELRNRMTV